MTIELTEEQNKVLSLSKNELCKAIHSPTHAEYVLIPVAEYESLSEDLLDRREQEAWHSMASKNMAARIMEDEEP